MAGLLSHISVDAVLFFLNVLVTMSYLTRVNMLATLNRNLGIMFSNGRCLMANVVNILSDVISGIPLMTKYVKVCPITTTNSVTMSNVF